MTKVKANDLCPCGSTKKYKKCCFLSDEQNRNSKFVYSESETMKESLQILRETFPDICFKNVSEQLNAKSYKSLQIQTVTSGNSCFVAEKFQTNEKVFNERDVNKDEYDLILLCKGAYRILHGGANIKCYTVSLKSFFANPTNNPSL